jgi:hypothetical protein
MALARDAVALFEHDTDVPLHHLHTTAVEIGRQDDGKEKQAEVKVPGLIHLRTLADRKGHDAGEPLRACVGALLHLQLVAPGGELAIVGGLEGGALPLGVVSEEAVPHLSRSCSLLRCFIEEDNDVRLSGLKIDVGGFGTYRQ